MIEKKHHFLKPKKPNNSSSFKYLFQTYLRQPLFYYAKTDVFKFNKQYTNYSATTNVDQILQKRVRDHRGKTIYAKDSEGKLVLATSKSGVPLGDVWEIPFLNPKAQERTGYPTQKPLHLLEKIILMASDPGDTIMDPFCGSGTTCVAAKIHNRNSIGIDISLDAVELANKRLQDPIKTFSQLLIKGEEAYKVSDSWVEIHLAELDYNKVPRNKGIDAILKHTLDKRLTLIRVQRPNEDLYSAYSLLKKAANKKGDVKLILIATSIAENMPHKIKDVCIIKSVKAQLEDLGGKYSQLKM